MAEDVLIQEVERASGWSLVLNQIIRELFLAAVGG